MEKLVIEIRTTNSAFESDTNYEVARMLRELAEKLDWGNIPGSLLDTNGNIVGTVTIFESEDE